MSNGRTGYPPFREQVALGLVPGFRWLRKFGMNPAVNGSGTVEDCWPPGTVRVLPTVAAAASTVSSSVEDDVLTGVPAAGTGAWTIRIEGLDANYDEIGETISMNGAGAVTTTQSFLRVNRAYALTAGTGGTNAGNISISVGGALQAYIEADEGQTHQTMYTVPRGHTWLVTDYHVHVARMAGATDIQIYAYIRPSTADAAWRAISDIVMYSQGNWHAPDSVSVIPQMTETRIQAVSSGATDITAVVSGYLINNNYLGVL